VGSGPKRRPLMGTVWFLSFVGVVAVVQVVRVLQHGPREGYPYTWPRILALTGFGLLVVAVVWGTLRGRRES
jgi:hypothetical protein